MFAASAEFGGEPSDEHTLQALGLQDGDERWRLGVADPPRSTPRSTGRCSSSRPAERAATARRSSSTPSTPSPASAPGAFEPDVEGYVHVEAGAPSTVFAHADRHVWALDPESGDPRWTFGPESELAGVATVGDVAFVGVDGAVYALDGSAG